MAPLPVMPCRGVACLGDAGWRYAPISENSIFLRLPMNVSLRLRLGNVADGLLQREDALRALERIEAQAPVDHLEDILPNIGPPRFFSPIPGGLPARARRPPAAQRRRGRRTSRRRRRRRRSRGRAGRARGIARARQSPGVYIGASLGRPLVKRLPRGTEVEQHRRCRRCAGRCWPA